MKNKRRIITRVISIIIILITLLITYKNYVLAITTDIGTMADNAEKNNSDFWNVGYKHAFYEQTNVYGKKQWICFSEKVTSGLIGDGILIRSVLDINVKENGKYSTTCSDKKVTCTNATNTYAAKKLAYLCYAATVKGSTGLVAGNSYNNGPRNALYYYFNSTDLYNLIGPFSKKREETYLTASKEVGAEILKYADIYAKSETTGSSATITEHSDDNAEIKVVESNGTSYSYIGPFTLTTAGTISSISITDGTSTPTIDGFANSVGGTIQDISKTPTNGNKFYIVVNSVLTNVDINIKINTTGSAGGGTITDPNTKKTSTGYIKARILFIGADSSQATAIFRGDVVSTKASTDSVTFNVKNNLGKLIVKKTRRYAGIQDYENIANLAFKIYYMNNGEKKYLRLNNQSSISSQATISIGASTSYNSNSTNATIIHTSSNGSVIIDNISNEYEYYIEEISEGSNKYDIKIARAVMSISGSGEKSVSVTGNNVAGPIHVELKGANNTATTVKLENYTKTGELIIEKVDKDNSNIKLGKVEFKLRNTDTGRYVVANKKSDGVYEITNPLTSYTTNQSGATILITNSSSGRITLKGLDIGNYEIIETKNPNYGYTIIPSNVSCNLTTSGKTITIKNEKGTGNIKIQKTDMDNEKHVLSGVSFKLKNSNGYIIAYDNNGNIQRQVTGTINLGGLTTTTNKNEATQFITDETGTIKIYDLLIGNYQVEEVSLGNNFGYELEKANENGLNINELIAWKSNSGSGKGNTASITVTRQTSTNTGTNSGTNDAIFNILTIKNKRVYIKISGYVWEELVSGKSIKKNYLWSDNDNDKADKRISNVTVRLKRVDGSIIDTKTTGTITNSNGQQEEGVYVFGDYLKDSSSTKIKINELEGAYIEFEYNGMCYKSVEIHANLNNGSKAIDDNLRAEFNGDYTTIVNNESKNSDDQSVYELNYDLDNNVSTLNYGGQYLYGYDGQKYPIAGINEQYLITANTKEATPNSLLGQTEITIDKIYNESVEEIPYINLGLDEREMPDLAVIEDVEQATISLNGYTHTYKYNQRFKYTDINESGFDMGVKFASEYEGASYTREIFSSDVSYNIHNSNSLQMNVKYKVSIRNEATEIYTKINQIVNYFDENYDISSIQDAEGNDINYIVDSDYNQNGYKRVYIDVNFKNSPETESLLYIEYQLQDEAINSVLNQELMLYSVTEITSYSSYSDSDFSESYAGIDRDSNPETTNPNDKETFEDDTDSAPSFIVTVREGRMLTGTVWEDNAIEELLSGTGYDKERKGDGIYTENENRIGNVKVDLLRIEDDIDLSSVNILDHELPIASLYKMDESIVEATCTTESNGYYEFVGVIPGKYLIRYTYGKNSVICDANGNPIENVEIEEYKSTIYRGGNKTSAETMDDFWYREDNGDRLSDARDEIGIKANGQKVEILEQRTTEEELTYGELSDEENGLESIEAITRAFELEYDYDEDLDHISEYQEYFRIEFEGVDLGIIKRPIQSIELIKGITYIKASFANGQAIIEGDPRTNDLQYVRVLPDGNISLEIASELIQGATLTIRYGITVDNTNAEIDYNDKEYYIYGITPSDKEGTFKLATITKLLDYLSNELQFNQGSDINNNWTFVDDTKALMEQGYLSQEAYDIIKGYNQVLQTEAFANMKPGENTTIEMEVSKLLANDEESSSLANYIEVNTLKDKTIENSIPGNYIPGKTDTEENDDDNVYVTITGPTGENKNYIPYIILGISSFIILVVGIVFIKKKVL